MQTFDELPDHPFLKTNLDIPVRTAYFDLLEQLEDCCKRGFRTSVQSGIPSLVLVPEVAAASYCLVKLLCRRGRC